MSNALESFFCEKEERITLCWSSRNIQEREFKGFAKTPELAPGESCEVCIFVSRESLASYNEAISAWQIDKGTYTFELHRMQWMTR